MKKVNVILVEICHGCEEFHKAIGHVQHDEIYGDMPRCILNVDRFDVWHSFLHPMISILNKKHAPRKSLNIKITHEGKIKSVMVLLLMNIPLLFMLINCVLFSSPSCKKQVENLVTILTTHLECMFHFQDVNLENQMNKCIDIIQHNKIFILTFLCEEILYFSRISIVLNLVCLWTIWIVWSKDLASWSMNAIDAQSTWHKEDKFNMNSKKKNKNLSLTCCKKILGTTTEVTKHIHKQNTNTIHKTQTQATNTNKTQEQTQLKHKWLFTNVYTYQPNNWKTFSLGESSIPYSFTNALHLVMLEKWWDKCPLAQGPKEQGVIEESTY
jgi:hypothetical protein